MVKIDENDKKAFLEGLTKLTKRHGITIGGCGCCGSPWIMQYERDKLKGGHYEMAGGFGWDRLSFVGEPE